MRTQAGAWVRDETQAGAWVRDETRRRDAAFAMGINMRRFLQPMLMLGAVLGAMLVVAATLRGRPKLQSPKVVGGHYQAADFQLTAAKIDQALARLAADEVAGSVAPPASTELIARRVSLALVGSGLSLEELRALELVPEAERIPWLTERLLEDRRWADYFAERFSRAFVGTNDGPFLLFRRRKFNSWLADQLQQDVGYDHIVREMLSADGLWTDTPQVNFVTATMDEANEGRGDPIRLAGRTSRAI